MKAQLPYSLEIQQIERELAANKESMQRLLEKVERLRLQEQKKFERMAPIAQTTSPQMTGIQNLPQMPSMKTPIEKVAKSQDLIAEQEFERKGRRVRPDFILIFFPNFLASRFNIRNAREITSKSSKTS